MWSTVLLINSFLWSIGAVYFIYSIGTAIITWSWKQFVLGLVIFVFLSVAQIVIAGIAEP